MIIFKCKMCGGDLEIDEQMTVGICQHCGSTMTLPKASEEKVTSLFNRANHYRRNSEYDKAIKVYENILNEENTNAEAYWGLVLCKYGIEYVEDPATGQRIPTCHRTQKTSIFLDVDYKQALEYADAPARQIYEAEAATIDTIQKQILAISAQEAPYDIFICYKETSATGSRTKDSVLAQDIYHHLTEAGYKVFFSRISLEDKLGTAYEPYIFAALNSSPVMVVVATSTESVSAVWTKNEWSRYLALINKGEKKTLIPVYRDMDPYDLPEEFAHLQAQDMGRLGFMQDLVRGVKKILETGNKPEQKSTVATVGETGATAQSLLDRAFICLEDSEWNKADELLERALDIEPKNAKAYIGKLMVELKVSIEDQLSLQNNSFEGNSNYQKALRFSDNNYKKTLEKYNQDSLKIVKQEELSEKEKLYQNVLMKANVYGDAEKLTEEEYRSIVNILISISGYKDADKLAVVYGNLAEKEHILKERARLGWKSISAGSSHTVGLKSSGTVLAVGSNKYNQLNVNDWREIIQVSARGSHSVGLKQDGKVIAVGDNSVEQCNVSHWQDIEAVVAGVWHTIGLKYDGTVVAVGNNSEGKLNVDGWSDIVAISAGKSYTVGLKSDGNVVATGNNMYGRLDVGEWSGVVAISARDTHTVGLLSDGTVIAVGNNSEGQLDVVDWRNILAISAGDSHTLGLKADGTVVAVGSNSYGQLNVGDWHGIVAVSAGAKHTVGLRSDGTVVGTGVLYSDTTGLLGLSKAVINVTDFIGDWVLKLPAQDLAGGDKN